MIAWQDKSDRFGERYTVELGSVDIDIAREHPCVEHATRWMLLIRWRLAWSHETRSAWIDPCDVERAKILALVEVRPLVDALAARAAEVAKEIAVVVADARLDAVV